MWGPGSLQSTRGLRSDEILSINTICPLVVFERGFCPIPLFVADACSPLCRSVIGTGELWLLEICT